MVHLIDMRFNDFFCFVTKEIHSNRDKKEEIRDEAKIMTSTNTSTNSAIVQNEVTGKVKFLNKLSTKRVHRFGSEVSIKKAQSLSYLLLITLTF